MPIPKLLVVDDSEICRKPFRKVGRDASGKMLVEVLEAETGEQGLELFKSNPDILYAVVDVHLPGIDGFEMLNAWRQHDQKRFEHTTIFMSCSDADDHHHDAPDFPTPSWILKPADPELFNRFLLSDVRMKMAVQTNSLSDTQRMDLRTLFEDSSKLSEHQQRALANLINSLTPDGE